MNYRLLIALLFGGVIAFWATPAVHAAGVIYVNDDASGANNGTSWANAYTYLQDALADAGPGDQIWLAEGVYYPDEGLGKVNNVQTQTFQLKNGVAIHGGFLGNESSLSGRAGLAFNTVLSGDIDKNDSRLPNGVTSTASGIQGNNAHRVVDASGTGATAILDRVIISGGRANATSPYDSGGGLYNDGGSPTINRVEFRGNSAVEDGGGMMNLNAAPNMINLRFQYNTASRGGAVFNSGSDPTLNGIEFVQNSATYGGAMFNTSGSSPSMTNVDFKNNSANEAGAMFNGGISSPIVTNALFKENNSYTKGGAMLNLLGSSPTLRDVTFDNNTTFDLGGAMANSNSSNPLLVNVTFKNNTVTEFLGVGGAMANAADSSPMLVNVIFQNNTADYRGGGLHNDASSPLLFNVVFFANSATNSAGGGIMNDNNSDALIINSTFTANFTGTNGGAIANIDSQPSIHNSILWANISLNGYTEMLSLNVGPTVNHSLMDATEVNGPWTNGGSNIIDGTDPLFMSGIDPRLQGCSPAINGGNNAAIPADLGDLDGDSNTTEPIPLDLLNMPRVAANTIDMGALERQNGADCLLNGSFENGISQWNTSAKVSRFASAQAYEGQALMLINNPSSLNYASQQFSQTGSSGDAYTLTFYVAGSKVPTSGAIGGRVDLLSGGAVVESSNCLYSGARGSFNWAPVTCQIVASSSYDSIRIWMGAQNVNGGVIGFDAVSIGKN